MSKHRLSHRVLVVFAQLLDDKVGWDKLPIWVGIPTLVGVRNRLREQNLFDTGVAPAKAELADPRWLRARSPDGTYNDLDEPAMGARGVRFGRNIPLDRTFPETEPSILQPSPRLISTRLLTRDQLTRTRWKFSAPNRIPAMTPTAADHPHTSATIVTGGMDRRSTALMPPPSRLVAEKMESSG